MIWDLHAFTPPWRVGTLQFQELMLFSGSMGQQSYGWVQVFLSPLSLSLLDLDVKHFAWTPHKCKHVLSLHSPVVDQCIPHAETFRDYYYNSHTYIYI